MDRLAQALLPILLIIEATLVPGGRLDVSATVDVPAVINSLTFLVIGRQLYLIWRRYQHTRGSGQDKSGALVEALKVLLPRVESAMHGEHTTGAQLPLSSGETTPLKVPKSQ